MTFGEAEQVWSQGYASITDPLHSTQNKIRLIQGVAKGSSPADDGFFSRRFVRFSFFTERLYTAYYDIYGSIMIRAIDGRFMAELLDSYCSGLTNKPPDTVLHSRLSTLKHHTLQFLKVAGVHNYVASHLPIPSSSSSSASLSSPASPALLGSSASSASSASSSSPHLAPSRAVLYSVLSPPALLASSASSASPHLPPSRAVTYSFLSPMHLSLPPTAASQTDPRIGHLQRSITMKFPPQTQHYSGLLPIPPFLTVYNKNRILPEVLFLFLSPCFFTSQTRSLNRD